MKNKPLTEIISQIVRFIVLRAISAPLYFLSVVPYIFAGLVLFDDNGGVIDSVLQFVANVTNKSSTSELGFDDFALVFGMAIFGLGLALELLFMAIGTKKSSYHTLFKIRLLIVVVGYALSTVVVGIDSADMFGSVIVNGTFLLASIALLYSEKFALHIIDQYSKQTAKK